MYAIEARGLTKSFRHALVVDSVDIIVERGEVVGLLGPNGAGKTTTLMMLLGITEPDAGSVKLLGHLLPTQRSAALSRANFTASYVALPSDLRVRQTLSVFADIYGVSRERVAEVVDLLDVSHILEQRGSELSSGQRTLVGLVKALLNHPELLVLDEPTASLDPEVADRVRRVLTEGQVRDGFAMLMTSHNMADIERMCNRVVFLVRGRVAADGTPDDLAARYGRGDLENTFLRVSEEEGP